MLRASLVVFVACAHSTSPQTIENTAATASEPTSAPAPELHPPLSAAAEANPSRVIQRSSTGGEIELAGNRTHAMEKAEYEMRAHCGPDKYTILQEGEEVIGSSGGVSTTAWRLRYQCH